MNRRMSYIAVACAILTVLAVSCAQDASTEPQTPTVSDDPTQIANKAPTAVAPETADLLTGELFTLDGSESSDTDGTVVGWNWDLGDGRSVSGKTTATSYATAGTYTITLTVTDDDGATAKDTAEVTVKEPDPVIVVPEDPTPIANKAPTAVASAKTDLLKGESFTVDGSGSSDTDGTVVGWNWDLGDGRSVSGKTTATSYATAGTYTITLTVTDDDGATAKSTVVVTVRETGTVIVEIQ